MPWWPRIAEAHECRRKAERERDDVKVKFENLSKAHLAQEAKLIEVESERNHHRMEAEAAVKELGQIKVAMKKLAAHDKSGWEWARDREQKARELQEVLRGVSETLVEVVPLIDEKEHRVAARMLVEFLNDSIKEHI